MARLLTDLGEEYICKNNLSNVSLTVGVYDDSTDVIFDTDDITEISTEPQNTNYSRKTTTFSVVDINGDWGIKSDNRLSFDFTDLTSTKEVDSYFIVDTFTAKDVGESSDSLHLIGTGALSKTYDLSVEDTLNIDSGTVGVKID